MGINENIIFETPEVEAAESVSAEEAVIVSEDGSVEVISNEETATEESIKIDFKPEEFVNNLGYMGKGMLGIFVVIGIIIASVYALAKFGNKSNKQ